MKADVWGRVCRVEDVPVGNLFVAHLRGPLICVRIQMDSDDYVVVLKRGDLIGDQDVPTMLLTEPFKGRPVLDVPGARIRPSLELNAIASAGDMRVAPGHLIGSETALFLAFKADMGRTVFDVTTGRFAELPIDYFIYENWEIVLDLDDTKHVFLSWPS